VRYLFGKHRHSLDAKGRVAIPRGFRDRLTSPDSQTLVLMEGFEGCLFCYPAHEFEGILDRLQQHSFASVEIRELLRWFSEKGSEVEMDGQGRIAINPEQREAAGLTKDVLLVGAMNRLELWSPPRFENRPRKSDVSELAERALSGNASNGSGRVPNE
jgi:MraZ protein